jgi:hypothetical protein
MNTSFKLGFNCLQTNCINFKKFTLSKLDQLITKIAFRDQFNKIDYMIQHPVPGVESNNGLISIQHRKDSLNEHIHSTLYNFDALSARII